MYKSSLIIPVYMHPVDNFIKIAEKRKDLEFIFIVTGEYDPLIVLSNCRKIYSIKSGYGAAVNIGAVNAKSENLIISNDDIILDDDNLNTLLNTKDAVFVPTVIDNASKKIESIGSVLDFMSYNRHNKNPMKKESSLHLTGSLFAVNKRIFVKSGMFDADYFMYYEDVDLSVRLKKIAGIKFLNDITVEHKHSFSNISLKRYYLQRNRILFILKNSKQRYLLLWIMWFMTGEIFVMLYQSVKERSASPVFARIDAMKMSGKFMRKRNAHTC